MKIIFSMTTSVNTTTTNNNNNNILAAIEAVGFFFKVHICPQYGSDHSETFTPLMLPLSWLFNYRKWTMKHVITLF